MSELVTYLVLPLARRDDGMIVQDIQGAVECASAEAAMRLAEAMAHTHTDTWLRWLLPAPAVLLPGSMARPRWSRAQPSGVLSDKLGSIDRRLGPEDDLFCGVPYGRQALISDLGPYSLRVFHIAVSLVGVPIHARADVVKVIVSANLALDYFSVDVLTAQNSNILAVQLQQHAGIADPLVRLT